MVLPKSKGITAGAEMMFGGAILLILSALTGEMHPFPHISTKAFLALGYLVVAGSLLGFSAFVWLLGRMPATRVASHAYVNPSGCRGPRLFLCRRGGHPKHALRHRAHCCQRRPHPHQRQSRWA